MALLLKGIAISSVFLARASLYWAADQSFNLSSISGVQHVGPVGQICNETPAIDKMVKYNVCMLDLDHVTKRISFFGNYILCET